VDIWGIKTKVLMAALPSERNEELIQAVGDMFPTDIVEMSNVLETSFSNLNMVLHCSTMILNTGLIESREGDFRFYTDGMTPSVCKISEIIDEERISIGRILGLRLQPQIQWLKETYNLEGNNLFEVLQGSNVYGGHGADAPKTMTHRYLMEDVPYLLVPVASFGRAFGVPCPVIESIILLAGKINDKDYFSEGRTLEKMGFRSAGIESIREKLVKGA
jgi:opine dehydrogenase